MPAGSNVETQLRALLKEAEGEDETLVSLEEGYLSSGRFEAEAQASAGSWLGFLANRVDGCAAALIEVVGEEGDARRV